jgi:hypothetical protein
MGCKEMLAGFKPGRKILPRSTMVSGLPSVMVSGIFIGVTAWELKVAIIRAGMATINPASGPEIPISKSARRVVMGVLIRMKAPMVPIKVGAGIK